jgi:hypothetical protein
LAGLRNVQTSCHFMKSCMVVFVLMENAKKRYTPPVCEDNFFRLESWCFLYGIILISHFPFINVKTLRNNIGKYCGKLRLEWSGISLNESFKGTLFIDVLIKKIQRNSTSHDLLLTYFDWMKTNVGDIVTQTYWLSYLLHCFRLTGFIHFFWENVYFVLLIWSLLPVVSGLSFQIWRLSQDFIGGKKLNIWQNMIFQLFFWICIFFFYILFLDHNKFQSLRIVFWTNHV